jgi:hypothetical protein
MSLEPGALFLSLVTGTIGLALMVYPYFLTETTSVVAVGLALGALLWVMLRRGL